MNRVLVIGPFPNPVHGMSLANAYISEYLKTRDDVIVEIFNTNFDIDIKPKDRQGRFELTFAIRSAVNLAKNILFLLTKHGSIAYFTPPQSWLGLLRHSPAILLSFLINKKTVLHIHGSRLDININNCPLPVRTLLIFILRKASIVISLTPSISKSFRKSLGLDNVTVCMNGVPIPLLSKTQISAKYATHPIGCLFLSNLLIDKGILELLEAVVILNSDSFIIHLDLAGFIEPALLNRIQGVFDRYPDYFTYHGVVFGIEKDILFRRNAIFCLPSHDEGMPLSILEAYSYGCTVVTTNVGGIGDVFQEPHNGYFCSPGDLSSIVSALLRAINSADSLSWTGAHNYAEANRKYSVASFGDRVFSALVSDTTEGN